MTEPVLRFGRSRSLFGSPFFDQQGFRNPDFPWFFRFFLDFQRHVPATVQFRQAAMIIRKPLPLFSRLRPSHTLLDFLTSMLSALLP